MLFPKNVLSLPLLPTKKNGGKPNQATGQHAAPSPVYGQLRVCSPAPCNCVSSDCLPSSSLLLTSLV